jgi:hypothetical protein
MTVFSICITYKHMILQQNTYCNWWSMTWQAVSNKMSRAGCWLHGVQ